MSLADDFLKDAGSEAQPQAPKSSLADAFIADAAPATAAPVVPTFSGSKTGGVIQGVRDLENAGAQWLYNSLPPTIRNAGDAADHWLYDKSGGAIGTKPGLNFNQAVTDQNAGYEASRAANNRDGIDWMRGLGQAASQTAGALVGGVPAMSAAGMGILSGAATPAIGVNDPLEFTGQKAKDVALGGLAGGAIGALGGAASTVLSPNISAPARKLMGEGIQLTPGQILGGPVKTFEDKAVSIPVVGDMIRKSQGTAVDDLNRATYARVLAPLKEAGFDIAPQKLVGREGVDAITDQVKAAYNSLVPKLSLKVDPQFANEFGTVKTMAANGLPAPQAAEFSRIIGNTVDKNIINGNSSGKTLQGMLSDLGKEAAGYRSNPNFADRQLGDALATVEQSIKDNLARTNPLFAGQLAKIDTAFANLARVQTAAASQGAPNGVFTAAQLSAAVKAGDKTVRDNAFARGQAFMQDLSDPAKTVLSSSVPNSGTADRAMAAGAAGALLAKPSALLNPALWGAAVPSMMYTKPGLALVNQLAQPRSAGMIAAGDALRYATPKAVIPLTAGLLGP